MPELAGRIYVPKLYRLDGERSLVVDFLASAVEASGGRVVYNSFADDRVAPTYMGAEDGAGRMDQLWELYSRRVLPNKSSTTCTGYRSKWRAYIQPTIGHLTIAQVTTAIHQTRGAAPRLTA